MESGTADHLPPAGELWCEFSLGRLPAAFARGPGCPNSSIWRDSNPRPTVYQTVALPLSYLEPTRPQNPTGERPAWLLAGSNSMAGLRVGAPLLAEVMVSPAAVETPGAQAAVAESCGSSRTGTGRSGPASRAALCRRGRRGSHAGPASRTGSHSDVCWWSRKNGPSSWMCCGFAIRPPGLRRPPCQRIQFGGTRRSECGAIEIGLASGTCTRTAAVTGRNAALTP